jgi:hypothetical protein
MTHRRIWGLHYWPSQVAYSYSKGINATVSPTNRKIKHMPNHKARLEKHQKRLPL